MLRIFRLLKARFFGPAVNEWSRSHGKFRRTLPNGTYEYRSLDDRELEAWFNSDEYAESRMEKALGLPRGSWWRPLEISFPEYDAPVQGVLLALLLTNKRSRGR